MKRLRLVAFTVAILTTIASSREGDAPELSLEDLMSIKIVTASKQEEPINEAPGVISTLSRDEIDRLGPANLLQILSTMSGIAPSSGYLFDRHTVAVQGDMSKVNTSHVLILIDGRPVREILEGGLSSDILMGFPTSAIDHIEVIKGPGSVLYGSDAFTGVINVVTRKPSENGAKLTTMTSTNWGRRVDGSVDFVDGDLKITQSATYDRPERLSTGYLYKTPQNNVLELPIEFVPTHYGAHTQLQYGRFNSFVGYAQSTSYSQIRGLIEHNTLEKTYGNIGYSLTPQEWWDLDVNTGITRSELKADNFPYSLRNSYETMVEATNHLKLGKGKAVIGGVVDYREGEEKNWSNDQVMNKADFTGFSGYAQLSYPVIAPVLVLGGMQYNQVSDLEPAWVPRVGAIWSLTPMVSVKGFWTNAFRAPSLNELMIDAPTNKGNKDLKPEMVETYDLSFSFNGHGIYASGNVFYSKLDDIIQAMPTSDRLPSGAPILQYRNTAKLNIVGGGCEFKDYVTRELLVSASANYQQSYDDDDEGILPIPQYTGKLGASYVSQKGWELGMSTIYLGEYSDLFTTNKVNTTPESSIQTDLNGRLSLARLLKMDPSRDLALRAQLKNAFNEYTYIPEWGGTTHDVLTDLRGRVYYLGMDMSI